MVTRITVTLSIFNFSTRFFAQIVENRQTQLSSPFLGPGDIFSKSYDENQIWSKCSGRGAAARGSDAQISGAIQLPYKSVFVITFQKMSPGLKNGLESCVSRFSTICAKNLVLKIKIDKVTVIRVEQITIPSDPPLYRTGILECTTAVHKTRELGTSPVVEFPGTTSS